jgi:hypothetical protein
MLLLFTAAAELRRRCPGNLNMASTTLYTAVAYGLIGNSMNDDCNQSCDYCQLP